MSFSLGVVSRVKDISVKAIAMVMQRVEYASCQTRAPLVAASGLAGNAPSSIFRSQGTDVNTQA